MFSDGYYQIYTEFKIFHDMRQNNSNIFSEKGYIVFKFIDIFSGLNLLMNFYFTVDEYRNNEFVV